MKENNGCFEKTPEDTGKTILDALQGVNRYLAIMNGRLEMLLLSELPEYVKSDLVKVYQAEAEASRILRSLNIFCHKTF